MATTDFVIFFLCLYFIIRGFMRGFLKSLIIPISIIIATLISIIYFENTNNMIIGLIIGLIGPFILQLIFKLILKKWTLSNKVLNQIADSTNNDVKPGFINRLAGAVLTLAWGGIFVLFTLILVAVLPPWGNTLTAIHKDVTSSASYYLVKPLGEKIFAATQKNLPTSTPITVTGDDAKSLAEDPRFQKALQDPEVQKEINTHDIIHLMSNPKIMTLTQQIMSDPKTLKKLLAVYSSQAPSIGEITINSPSVKTEK